LGLNVPRTKGLNENDRNQTEEEIEAAIDRLIQTAMEAYSEGMQAGKMNNFVGYFYFSNYISVVAKSEIKILSMS
jgi:hypothetical protein